MKALPVEELPEGDWLYEIKHDGYRALAFKNGKNVRLVSRNKKAFDYPQLLDALKLLPAEHFILDGEITALDEKGHSSFHLLQVFKSSRGVPLECELHHGLILAEPNEKMLNRLPARLGF